jgi:hypothetical protein
MLSAGIDLGGGQWFLMPGELPGLTVTMPQDGIYDLSVEAQSGHLESGNVASRFATLRVAVSNAAPLLNGPMVQSSRPGRQALFDLGEFVDVAADALFGVEVNWGDGSVESISLQKPGAIGSLAHTYANHGEHTGVITVRDKDGAMSSSVLKAVVGPAEVRRVTVNDGLPQRSRVTSMQVEFTGPVELAPDAITVRDQRGRVIPASVSVGMSGGVSTARLGFSGRGIVAGSLADGRYTLTIDGAKVVDPTGSNQTIDADGDGVIGDLKTQDVRRLFGDRNGDGRVDQIDAQQFRAAYRKRAGDAAYVAEFDYNGNGVIGQGDLEQFVRRYRRV